MAVVEQVDRDRLVRTFLELVAIDSPSGEEAEISAELQRRFVDDMVTACRIMAAIVTQPHDS
jgi:di/tripeptidase